MILMMSKKLIQAAIPREGCWSGLWRLGISPRFGFSQNPKFKVVDDPK
jgi:hypothetical protein